MAGEVQRHFIVVFLWEDLIGVQQIYDISYIAAISEVKFRMGLDNLIQLQSHLENHSRIHNLVRGVDVVAHSTRSSGLEGLAYTGKCLIDLLQGTGNGEDFGMARDKGQKDFPDDAFADNNLRFWIVLRRSMPAHIAI